MKHQPSNLNNINTNHLSDDQCIIALIDINDLGDQEKQHVTICKHCQSQIKQLEMNLNTMTQKILSTVPPSNVLFRMDLKSNLTQRVKHIFSFQSALQLKPLFLLITLCLVMTTVWFNPLYDNVDNNTVSIEASANELAELTDMYYMEMYPMPSFYMDLTGPDAEYFDSEFMEYVDPSNNDGS